MKQLQIRSLNESPSKKEGKFTHDPTNDIPGGGLNENPHPKAEKCRCI